jgi:hypothetical protein
MHMKIICRFLFVAALFTGMAPMPGSSQSVAINADSSLADASAILDLKSTIKGMLVPRMTFAQRNVIAAPAVGLLIYQTDNTPGFYYYDGGAWGAVKGAGGGGGGAGSGSDTLWAVNGNDITNTNSGYVGINAKAPLQNRLTIGDPGNFNGNDIAFGNGTQVAGIGQTPTVLQVASNTDMSFLPGYGQFSGKFGIGVTGTLQNKLQIGNTASFNGNDIAFGNGTQVTGISQTPGFLQISSNTDMVLLPEYRAGYGRVGINTTTPKACLHVAGIVTQSSFRYYYYGFNEAGSINAEDIATIIADHSIEAESFIAPSDARIKDVAGVSNTAKDLKTLEAIRVTDYTMKDKGEYGNKPFKKVIAQEVEKIYPQVISKQAGFIPNVYRPTDTIERTAAGLLLRFAADHHLTADAKKLRALGEGQHFMEYTIVSIPSPTEVVIADTSIGVKRMFVYGQEVPDFRKVDYDGLFTLNISATQELSKEFKQMQRDLVEARADMRLMAKEIRRLKHPVTGNRLTSAKLPTRKTIAKQARKI